MSAPYWSDDTVTLYLGDCRDVLRTMPDASVDSVVTDPPYGLEFMGKAWDSFGGERSEGSRGGTSDKGILPGYGRGGTNADVVRFKARGATAFQAWCEDWAAECLRVLKPGGHLLAFGGSRTWHRFACAVEDAGFEMRDSIAWLYGSGFPKSLNVERSVDTFLCVLPGRHRWTPQACTLPGDHVCPSTAEGRARAGDGTALKPAFEPIVVGRKPLIGTVAANVLAHGTGALNIDGCRVQYAPDDPTLAWGERFGGGKRNARGEEYRTGDGTSGLAGIGPVTGTVNTGGRWPTNVILDGSQAAELDRQTGVLTSGLMKARTDREPRKGGTIYGADRRNIVAGDTYADSGGASRFFPTFHYEAKAPTSERPRNGETAHPTVKPLDLMRWLVRLVTPPGGTVLDPFAGSGTTAEACVIEGFRCVLIEREADYLPLIVQRLTKPIAPVLDFGASA